MGCELDPRHSKMVITFRPCGSGSRAQGAKHHVAYLVRVHSNAPCVPSLFVTGTSGLASKRFELNSIPMPRRLKPGDLSACPPSTFAGDRNGVKF
jgi:hypothetical protein